jgi:hypothetical protein
MASTTNLLSPTWTAIREQLRDRREAHAARKALEHELAAYISETDLNDFEAILDRHSDEETAVIRGYLAGRRG